MSDSIGCFFRSKSKSHRPSHTEKKTFDLEFGLDFPFRSSSAASSLCILPLHRPIHRCSPSSSPVNSVGPICSCGMALSYQRFPPSDASMSSSICSPFRDPAIERNVSISDGNYYEPSFSSIRLHLDRETVGYPLVIAIAMIHPNDSEML